MRQTVFPWRQIKKQKGETMAMTRDNYWGLCGEIGASSFSGIISGSWSRRHAPRKSATRGVGFGGDSRLHLPRAKFPIRYVFGPQALIFLPKMRHGNSNQGKTSRRTTDTRLNSEELYEQGLNHRIAIRELGVGAFNDFMGRLSQLWGIKTRRRNERSHHGIESINARASHWDQFVG